MKKIFLLVFALLLGIAPVYGQDPGGVGECDYLSSYPPEENCPAPWLRVTFDIPVVCQDSVYNVRVSVCYYCYISANAVCYIVKKIEVPNGASACVQMISLKDQAEQWLIHHTTKYCGLEVCGTPDLPTIRIAYPMCATISFTPSTTPGNYGSYTVRYFEGECQKLCVKSFNWCWCNCVPGECWDEDCPDPHTKILNEVYVAFPPLGNCPATNYDIYLCDPIGGPDSPYYYNLKARYSWSDCFWVKTGCLDGGFDRPILPREGCP